jgi:eukaryotic-like serine/threonine-protein kinase
VKGNYPGSAAAQRAGGAVSRPAMACSRFWTMQPVATEKQSWEFEEGHEIAPGRSVLKPLGGGNRYEVYVVWDEHLFAIMVAKVVRPDLARDERTLRGLRREAEALDALAHPVILRGFGSDLEGASPHVLVEHIEGPTLRRLIRRGGPLPVEQVLPLGMHVASAIHYMAAEGWVHLDLKPDNLVMGISPRVIDLSLARTLERARRLRDYIGTNAYMAPEQCVPDGEVGPPADVWGLGATLYHAVAGRLPFPKPRSRDDADAPEDRFPQLTEEVRPWPRPVSAPLSEAILACLHKHPAARPTAREVALELQPMVERLPRKLLLGRRGQRPA